MSVRTNYAVVNLQNTQPRSQGLRCETVTKTLVKFVLSFQNFGEKIACAVRHNRIAITVEYGCVSLRMRFFSQNFGTIKRILPGSSSPPHREGPGTEVAEYRATTQSKQWSIAQSTIILFDFNNMLHAGCLAYSIRDDLINFFTLHVFLFQECGIFAWFFGASPESLHVLSV